MSDDVGFYHRISGSNSVVIAQERERRDIKGGLVSWLLCLGFGLSLYVTLFFGNFILVIYIEDFFEGFFSLGFPRVNCRETCECVSFSDPLYVVIMKMYYMIIKLVT